MKTNEKHAHDYSTDQRVVCHSCRARLAPTESLRCPYCGRVQPKSQTAQPVAEAGYVYEHSRNA